MWRYRSVHSVCLCERGEVVCSLITDASWDVLWSTTVNCNLVTPVKVTALIVCSVSVHRRPVSWGVSLKTKFLFTLLSKLTPQGLTLHFLPLICKDIFALIVWQLCCLHPSLFVCRLHGLYWHNAACLCVAQLAVALSPVCTTIPLWNNRV